MRKFPILLSVLLGFVFLTRCSPFIKPLTDVSDDTRNHTIQLLKSSVIDQPIWVRVHAAEYLLDLGYTEGIYERFQKENESFGVTPISRIGIWRVLAQATEGAEKEGWIDSILNVYKDSSAIDRLHAAEALAKLKVSAYSAGKNTVDQVLSEDDQVLTAFTWWSLAYSNEYDKSLKVLFDQLSSIDGDPRVKKLSAYAIRHIRNLSPEQWNDLAENALKEDRTAQSYMYQLSAAFSTVPEDSTKTALFNKIKLGFLAAGKLSITNAKEMCSSLAEAGTIKDIDLLDNLIKNIDTSSVYNNDHDLKITAAYALLKIDRKREHSLSILDWFVVFLYLGGMLVVGWYYSNKNKTSEDYLLGGRKMNPLAVGISLFATLLSTLSYLSYPGEMINYGPIIFTGMLAFPLVYYTVGWWIIPKIMSMNVTSAYEILENRLGISVRMLAVTFFLLLRILWMASIMYVTIDVALFSVIPIDKSYVPLLGLLLLSITIIYTSMGGIKAVVITDVIQTAIFIFGAFLCVIITCVDYGSFVSWFPDHWLDSWSEPRLAFDATERLTVGNAVLTLFLWYICTTGGDQTAIQRYLSTKDIKAARKTLRVSLYTNLLAKCLLALVGLAVLAYFMRNNHMLEYGKSITQQADSLFPRFILVGMPSGISGLLIAALFAAAMSSLSSGLNSVSTVVSEDVIKRFDINFFAKKGDLNRIKIISYFIGGMVMILSLFIGNVQGNLIDIINKVVNLFVAPLFVLFFMAFFIPFATTRSTFAAGIISIATAISIAFFGAFGITVLWILPMSLFAGVIGGIGLSFIETSLKKG